MDLDEQDWPTVDDWVWLFTNDHIPCWMTFQDLREEWKSYIKRGVTSNEDEEMA